MAPRCATLVRPASGRDCQPGPGSLAVTTSCARPVSRKDSNAFSCGAQEIGGNGDNGFGANGSAGYVIPISADKATMPSRSTSSPRVRPHRRHRKRPNRNPPGSASSSDPASRRPFPARRHAPTPARAASRDPTAGADRDGDSACDRSGDHLEHRRGAAAPGQRRDSILGCAGGAVRYLDPADCAQAVGGFDVRLVSDDGEVLELADATVGEDGSVTLAERTPGHVPIPAAVIAAGNRDVLRPDLPTRGERQRIRVHDRCRTTGGPSSISSTCPRRQQPASVPGRPANPALLDSDADGIPDVR